MSAACPDDSTASRWPFELVMFEPKPLRTEWPLLDSPSLPEGCVMLPEMTPQILLTPWAFSVVN